MNEILAALVQTTFARSAQDPQHSARLLAAVVAAVEGDTADLRTVIAEEQTRTIEHLTQIQAFEIPE